MFNNLTFNTDLERMPDAIGRTLDLNVHNYSDRVS